MKTAVIILNWNTEGFLRQFLPGLLSSVASCEDTEVIVADNASTDASVRVMQESFPEVKTIIFNENHGFTGGYNRAIEQTEAEYVVLINSDIEVTEGWLEPLVAWMDTHPECGACAPKLHSFQNRDMFEYAGAAGGYVDRYGYPFCRGRILGRVEKDNGQYDTIADVFWATGACLMVRRDVFIRLGGLDERFFAHMEEIDLCWRMQLHGYRVSIIPQSVVYHVGGGTLPASSPFKLYLNFRNNLMMLSNNLSKTFALGYLRSGNDIRSAAVKGMRKAGRRIWTRKMLDRLSAIVYFLTGKKECCKAVLRAHKDYEKGKRTYTAEEICGYLRKEGSHGHIRGWYKKWIIISSSIEGKDFYNY